MAGIKLIEVTTIIFGIVILIFLIQGSSKVLIDSLGALSIDLGFLKIPLTWIVVPLFLIAAIIAIIVWFKKSLQESDREILGLSETEKKVPINQTTALRIAENDLKNRKINVIAGRPPRTLQLNDDNGWRIIFKSTDPEGEWIVDVLKNGRIINSAPYEDIKEGK